MSNWKHQFESSQIVPKIREISEKWENAPTKELNPGDLDNYARLLKVLRFVLAACETVDADLYSTNTWQSMQGSLSNLQNYTQSFLLHKHPQHIQQANAALDEILQRTPFLPIRFTRAEVKAVVESAAAFEKQVHRGLQEVADKNKQSQAEVQKLAQMIQQQEARLVEATKSIDAQKGRLDQAITTYQQQFSTAEAKRAADFTSVMQKNVETAASNLEAQKKELSGMLGASKVTLESTLAGQKTQFDDYFSALNDTGKKHVERLTETEEKVRRIFNVVGNVSVSGDYKNTAERDSRMANWLRGGAIAFMLIMLGTGAFTFVHSIKHPEVDWRVIALRFTLSIVCLIPAVYLAQESAKHRERERQSRKLHLELAAIDAYLVNLPDDQRNTIKSKLTEKFFGVPDATPSKDDSVSKKDLLGVVSTAVTNLTKPR